MKFLEKFHRFTQKKQIFIKYSSFPERFSKFSDIFGEIMEGFLEEV